MSTPPKNGPREEFTTAAFSLENDAPMSMQMLCDFVTDIMGEFSIRDTVSTVDTDPATGEYILAVTLADQTNGFAQKGLRTMKQVLRETEAVLKKQYGDQMGTDEEVEMPLALGVDDSQGISFVTSDPQLLVNLLGTLSNIHGFGWEDPRTCCEAGYSYCLEDIVQVIEREDALSEFGRETEEEPFMSHGKLGGPTFYLH